MDTSASLLERLKHHPDEESWRRLDLLYGQAAQFSAVADGHGRYVVSFVLPRDDAE